MLSNRSASDYIIEIVTSSVEVGARSINIGSSIKYSTGC